MKRVDVIIPFRKWDWMVNECVKACDALVYSELTIRLVPDAPLTTSEQDQLKALHPLHPVVVHPSGGGNPSKKRNIAMRASSAPLVALVDSDAYPHPDWLNKALPLFSDSIGIVAGPNLTPPEDPLQNRIAGLIMASPLGFGAAYIRHTPKSRRMVNEMPTCNMIFSRENGLYFREDFDTAEDMLFCADMRAQGKAVLYDPEVLVYHHRRPLWSPFVRQFYHYGFDKGRLTRKGYQATYIWHAAPAVFLIYQLALMVAIALNTPSPYIFWAATPFLAYFLIITLECARLAKGTRELLLAIPTFVLAHMSYGAGYWIGMLNIHPYRTSCLTFF